MCIRDRTIAGSRPGSQALNLQGIWNDTPNPPWSSNYTNNINVEMNYWPCEVLGLPEDVHKRQGSGGGREQGLGGSVQEAGRNPGGKNLLEGKEVSAVCLGGLTAAIRC